jgi:hypothetical protein
MAKSQSWMFIRRRVRPIDSGGGTMRKKLTCLVLVLVICTAVAVAGCTSSTSNNTIQQKANEEIAAAKSSLADAKAKGVPVPADEQAMLTKAEGELKTQPLLAVVDAAMAKANIDNDIKDAFNVANKTYDTALGAAQSAIKSAVPGTDLTQANASLASAQAAKTKAVTIPDYYNPTSGPIYFANLSAQQAAAASNAKSVANGQAQGATAVEKQLQGQVSSMITQMNNWLKSKGYDPSTFTVGIVKVSPDATVVTGIAAPQVPAPGQPLYTTFVFTNQNGQYVLKSAT